MEFVKKVERSIIKTYRKEIWSRFIKGVNEYNLIEDGDKIAIAISGGKDSLLLAKLFQEIIKHGKRNFSIELICMDPGYRKDIRKKIEENARILNIPMKIYDSPVFQVAGNLGGDKPCYLCARMRRGSLYAKAQELGCNKLALGHHHDDVIETVLMNVLFSGNFKTMMPRLHSSNFENMELIRPMVFIREDDIRRWVLGNGIEPIDCACTVTEKENFGARVYTKNLIAQVKKDFPNVEMSIYRSAENVELGAILGIKDREGAHRSFLEKYGGQEEVF